MQYKIFWCKVNKYYTDKWLASDYLEGKQGIFIASCVVTDRAKRKWIKFVSDSIKSIKQWEKIFVSWCWAFKDWRAQSDFFELYPELESHKDIIEILGEDPKQTSPQPSPQGEGVVKNIQEKLKNIPQLYTKKFVLIQWGCDSFCSFCLTVKKRWRHFFRNKEDIKDEINEFEKNGWKEVVLTWVNLSAWGLDSTNDIWKSRFAELLEYLLKETIIKRLRISSLGPEFIDDKCIEIFKNTRIYPHFHFSVQSWSTKVLKAMARHYSWDYMRDVLKNLRAIKREDGVDISIWADIIVWFPWETEDNFKKTLDLIKTYNITKVHAFPFSAHNMAESVPAGSFKDQVDGKIKKERMWEIMNLSDHIRDEFIDDNIWKPLEVLIEQTSPQPSPQGEGGIQKIKWKGWTQNYIEADSSNFEISEGIVGKNEIVKGKLIK